jgi:uncharacterized protein (DUF1501 family)
MKQPKSQLPSYRRRNLLKAGGYGLALGAAQMSGVAPVFSGASAAGREAGNGKIFVVLELSGGNDGLNTLVPYRDDAYYRHRPNLGIRENRLRKIDDHFGFNPDMAGFERLYKDGKMAVFHG